MDTKSIGNIGEACVLAKLVKHHIPVYIPFGDNEAADLVANIEGRLVRIQVKTCYQLKTDGESYVVDLRRNKNPWTAASGQSEKYSSDEIDYFATYCVATDQICWFDCQTMSQSSVTLRISPAKNGASKNVRYEKDYLIDNQSFMK